MFLARCIFIRLLIKWITATEILKQQNIGALGKEVFKSRAELPSGCAIVPAAVIYKLKVDGRKTCRLVGRGDDKEYQKHTSHIETFSSVSSDGDNAYTLSAMQAYNESRKASINVYGIDIVGGFLRIPRDSKSCDGVVIDHEV